MNHRAVVLGASMAGLCTARVLSEHFDEVVVIERDDLTQAGTEPRPHVPQGRHPHLLLVSGAQRLEGWFPGIVASLIDGGAVEIDLCADFYWHQGGGVQVRPASDLRGPSMSRPFLESAVRHRVAALPGVVVRSATTVTGLDLDAPAERVTGVSLAGGEHLAADLVVDCTGRTACTVGWLAARGFDEPETSLVHVDTRYVSRTFLRGDEPDRDWKAAAVIDEPSARRLALLLPIEDEKWLLVMAGLNGETPPTDDAEALAYAESLPSPVIADMMRASTQVGSPVTHRFPANQRRHVEKLRRPVAGWLLLGDAVCSFDPIYGQGMSSAALQAEVLGECLSRHPELDQRLTRSFFKAAGRIVANPWSIAVGGDFGYPGTEGKKPPGTDLVNRYMDRVTLAGQVDEQVVLRMNEVIALIRRPESLLAPAFAFRVLRSAGNAGR